MKIWVKFLLGIIIGVVVAFLVEGDRALDAFDAVSEIVLNIGRYVVFPLVLFSAAVGAYELRREKRVLAVLGRALLYLIGAGALLAVIGTLSTILLRPGRIPIVIEEEIVYSTPTLREALLAVFPRNLFQVFNDTGNYLLPVFMLALVIGLNLNFDRPAARPAIQLFESLSRLFYNINAFVLEIIGIGFIPLAAAFTLRCLTTPELSLYRELVLIFFIDTVVILFVIYPVLLYFLGGRKNPFVWIYAGLGNLLAAAVTGDAYFGLAAMIRHGSENYGTPRRIGAVTFPLFTLFGKAGTAMVTGASFVLIVSSYSSLGITVAQAIWIMLFAFLASTAVGPFPGIGVFVALSLLSKGFTGGYEEGYLILKPLVPIMMSFAVSLDVLTASLSTMLIARHEGVHKKIDTRDYV